MGVNGLWTVIQPCARPTNLATLNRKRLAVDASIWIYQFLKAVRDKEGHALRNSHVVGFFRRICKLLWFGIRPVFVFDGGAPALKRQTILGRKRRREGRREDAVRTAGKLLAVQMQRIAEEKAEKRRRDAERGLNKERANPAEEEEEAIPSADKLVYEAEVGMSQQERQRTRKFHKQDQYHLPDLEGDISSMARADDPRVMSVEELEEYARQFNSGEDINLYDFSKIDFDGEFFKSLPSADRYNILNAARLRSRLRMGLSKEQLDDMFPDRMAFSKFQIERVRERNNLTQRLMKEAGMSGLDLTITGGGRIAGEKDREYILVKNEGAEGGWALGVVSRDKDRGEAHKPIDVDALEFQYQNKDEETEGEDDDDFEDVPIEGLNRLPKPSSRGAEAVGDEESLFVDGDVSFDDFTEKGPEPRAHSEEEEEVEDIQRAIALSLKNQHEIDGERQVDDEVFDEVDRLTPEWTQKAVPESNPLTSTSGRMVAHIVNNRSNAAVPKRRESDASSSESELDFQAALLAARKRKAAEPKPAAPKNLKNPFDGPLPFPKLEGFSLFPNKSQQAAAANKIDPDAQPTQSAAETGLGHDDATLDDLAGGFEREPDKDAPSSLPPWMTDHTDIRETMKKQKEFEAEINAEDRETALEEEMEFQRQRKVDTIEIESSSDDDSEVEILDTVPLSRAGTYTDERNTTNLEPPSEGEALSEVPTRKEDSTIVEPSPSPSPEPEFEDIQIPGQESEQDEVTVTELPDSSPEPEMEDVNMGPPTPQSADDSLQVSLEHATVSRPAENPANTQQELNDKAYDDLFGDSDVDEYSDPEDEELFANLAKEAEEHARFASSLNNKSEKENREAYEKELRALRTQQKKDRRDADEVTQVMITECQNLLRLFGIPYIMAPMEAEAQCAELVHLGLVDGIVTDDSDIFLFGGTRVYKNMFNGNKLVECYLASDLEKELSLSREQLISIALLLGSDYTDGLSGVGPVTALEILSEFPPSEGGLAAFRDWWAEVQQQRRSKEEDASNPFRRKFRKSNATKLFLPVGFPNPAVHEAYLHPQVDDTPEAFQWGVPDLEGLRRFLMSTIGWSKERTDEVLVPVIRDMNRRDVEGTQSNITRYFEGGVGVGAKEAFAPRQRAAKTSKRMTQAVNKLRANAGINSLASGDTSGEIAGSEPTTTGPRTEGKRKRDGQATGGDDGVDEFADGNGPEEEDGDGNVQGRAVRSGRRGKKARISAHH
ncbi:DNA-repair protein rad13 [Sodiomyces alkalinus F11]|uniref:DNA-repair protein rad13 n=1 Tax=Sodiomyces alkalinus (strain CBS 110278 / VKM F-3762 / F11) TaxID=1314773 RepID=A0A3N2Q6B9_SODAK|nr:DNA-repair protein rad13 [Sodiomyces alkalinus F11]ROT42292.1 DNA-repair protein rad13 [Sodiomyces alkalinus F11]